MNGKVQKRTREWKEKVVFLRYPDGMERAMICLYRGKWRIPTIPSCNLNDHQSSRCEGCE